MIRPAEMEDFAKILQMSEKFHRMSQHRCGFDYKAMSDTISRLMQDENSCLLVSEAGMVGGTITTAYCDTNWKMAVELFWWSEDGHGKSLLRGFEDWAEEMGADEVRMSTLSAVPRTGSVMPKLGYDEIEVSHARYV